MRDSSEFVVALILRVGVCLAKSSMGAVFVCFLLQIENDVYGLASVAGIEGAMFVWGWCCLL